MKQSESEVLGKENSFVPMKRSQSGDRISQLPDAILCHILSFVTFKQSVQTSILSKRWFPVWKYVPVIDVDDSTLLLDDPIAVTEHSVHSSFTKFMSNVFNRCHEAPICKFVLKCRRFDVFLVNLWIIAAVKRRIQELNLCITMGKKFKISGGLFAYQELVRLKLGKRFILDVPGSLVFPNLQELHLDGIEFDDDAINKFLSGCPVLEDLHMICPSEKWYTLVIKVPALKFFTIDISSYNEDTDSRDNEFKFILETPNLEVLDYSGCEPSYGFCFGSLNSLNEAILDISTHGKAAENAIEIVTAIVNAKIICLTDQTLELLHCDYRDPWDIDWPVFHNVTELRLGIGDLCHDWVFNKLLRNSPNLEVLILDADLAPYGVHRFEWESPSRVPYCMSQHLKVVNIWGYNEECVGEFIKYVLENGQVLKECTSARTKSKINKDLLKYLMRK